MVDDEIVQSIDEHHKGIMQFFRQLFFFKRVFYFFDKRIKGIFYTHNIIKERLFKDFNG
jgi:hypothetical protein